jgi:amino acid permease
LYTNNEKIRSWIGRNNFGEHVSGIGSSLLILFPLSIPRTASSLTFSSLIGVLCSAYLSIAVATVFFSDKTYIPSINDNLNKMDSFKFT